MEMIDVLQKLKEIAESKPELVKDAVENVERTNPKAVTEGGMKDYLHDEAEKLSREEFIKKHGESLAGFWDSINGSQEATESKSKPDFLDMDKDGDKKEPMKKAIKDKEMKKESVNEAIQISTDSPQEASMMMQILKLAGVQHVVIVINETKHQMIGYFGSGRRFGCKISYVYQEQTVAEGKSTSPGLAHALDSAYHLSKGKTVFFGIPGSRIRFLIIKIYHHHQHLVLR